MSLGKVTVTQKFSIREPYWRIRARGQPLHDHPHLWTTLWIHQSTILNFRRNRWENQLRRKKELAFEIGTTAKAAIFNEKTKRHRPLCRILLLKKEIQRQIRI